MRQKEIKLIVYAPTTEEGWKRLANKVAEVHAQTVFQHINALNIPLKDKQRLSDAVVETARKRERSR